MNAELSVADLRFAYTRGAEELFDGLTHRFTPGAVTALTGPSGRGKSTLLYVLGLMLTPSAGVVHLGDVDASALPDRGRARLRATSIGFVFQDAELDPSRPILDSVVEPGLYAGLSRGELEGRARILLERFGLGHGAEHRPGQVSGGQAQRVAVCRALVNTPAVVLAHEPTGNLDPDNASLVLDALAETAAEGRTVVVATHDPAVVATVGRQAATEAAVAAELSGPAARVLTVTDSGGTGFLTGATVTTFAGLESAEAALARDIPVDTVNAAIGAGGTRVAVTHVVGTLDRGVELTRGRLPGTGEVVVPEAKLAELGLAQPSGALEAGDGCQWAVVGAFEARTPFEDLDGYALAVPAVPASLVVQQVRVLAPDTAGTRAMQDSALAVIDPAPRSSQVQTARALAAGNETITGELAGLGRSLLLLILGAGAFFVAVVGAGTGYGLVVVQGGALGMDFVVGVAVLAALTAVVASLLPAAFAAFRDPVRVMRTA